MNVIFVLFSDTKIIFRKGTDDLITRWAGLSSLRYERVGRYAANFICVVGTLPHIKHFTVDQENLVKETSMMYCYPNITMCNKIVPPGKNKRNEENYIYNTI